AVYDHRPRRPRHPLSHVARARRVGRDEPGPGLLRRLRRPAHGPPAGPGGPRPHLHHRPRQRAVRRGDRGPRPARPGPDPGVAHRGHGRLLAGDHRGQPAPLGRPGEGRHPPRHRRRRQRRLGPVGEGRRQAALEAAGRPVAGAARRLRPLQLHLRRDHARGGPRDPPRARRDEGRSGGGTPAGWLPGLHHLGRLARLPGRETAAPLPGGGRRRLVPLQDEGGARRRGQRAPGGDHPGGDRPEPPADDGRQPGVGRRRGHRPDGATGAVRPVVDRGADQPRRRARPRRHRPGGGTGRRRNRGALPQPRDVQAAPAGRGDPLLPARRLPPGRGQRGPGGAAAGGQVRRPGLPPRGRRRAVRVRAAPVDLRLRRRQRLADGSAGGVRRPPARALRRSGDGAG
ncbi:MAG: L-fuconate dehydratase, partial [uncultured Phycisphaerae bacterium]